MASSVFLSPDIDSGAAASSLIPNFDNTYDLGSSSFRWRSAYIGTSVIMGGAMALGTTSTDGVTLTNSTAATSGVTVQISPRLRLRGTAWDTSASETVDFFLENLPATAATPTGTLKFGYSLNGAAATYPATLSSAGVFTTLSSMISGGNFSSGSSPDNGILFGTLGRLATTGSDGQFELTNNAVDASVGLDVTTNNVLKLRNRAQNAYTTLDCLGLKASGAAGASGTGTVISAITVVNGIVTQITVA